MAVAEEASTFLEVGWCDPSLSADFVRFCNAELRPALAERRENVRDERKLSNVKLSACLRSKCLELVSAEGVLSDLLSKSLIKPALIAVQSIVAPPLSVAQELHRDTDRGSGNLVTLVVSCNGAPLRTRIQPRSHLEEHRILYRSSERAADLAVRERATLAPGSTSLLYDGALYHGGGANPSTEPDDARLFFLFVDASKEPDLIEEIAEANYVPPRSRPWPLKIQIGPPKQANIAKKQAVQPEQLTGKSRELEATSAQVTRTSAARPGLSACMLGVQGRHGNAAWG